MVAAGAAPALVHTTANAALEQARAAGNFTPVHDAWWEAADHAGLQLIRYGSVPLDWWP